tara:strand:+ start:708 stop:1799 length:1092 start_codon:yes stop_codon:yes gene_type:complete
MVDRHEVSSEKLKEVIDEHAKWLKDESKGARADLRNAQLQHADLNWVDLRKANLQNVDLSFANLKRANLDGANLKNADLVRADLDGVKLNKADLSGADLRESNILIGPKESDGTSRLASLLEANFFQANLSRSNLTRARLDRANFTEAILDETNFSRASLFKANFCRATLDGANFSEADLRQANVSNAHIGSANFEHCDLSGVLYEESWSKSDYAKFRRARIENSYGSPVFKRYVQDQDFLGEYQDKHPMLFNFWYYTSRCGRSMSLWILLSFVIALLFGVAYANYFSWGWLPNLGGQIEAIESTAFTPYYFSFVTFTTLGFGDITPKGSLVGEIWVTVEVMLGYLMLGGLISIFSSKIAQRS